MSDPTIRRAGHNDLTALAVLFDEYRQFYGESSDRELARRFLQARMTKNESVIFLAEHSAGEVLGFCQLYPSFCSLAAAPIYVLYDLFTRPQDRQRGIASGLLGHIERYARDNGFVRLELSTARDNQAAQKLYHTKGWVRDEVFLHYGKATLPQE